MVSRVCSVSVWTTYFLTTHISPPFALQPQSCAPSNATGWYVNFDGKIWLAKSKTPGRYGIGGPYQDLKIILQPDSKSQPWEGLQGTDSMFVYNLKGKDNVYLGFYGRANTQSTWKAQDNKWFVGLATANSLEGPWVRAHNNPVNLNNARSGIHAHSKQ